MMRRVSLYRVIGVMILILVLAPVGWLVICALRPSSDVLNHPYSLSGRLTAQNLVEAFHLPGFARSLTNSFVAALLSSLLTMAICVPVGYASSRYEFTGRRFVQGLGIAGYILSPVILAIPYFRLLATVDLTNSVVGITLLHVALSIPFCLSLLDLLFQSVPSAPEEVALLAGMEGLTLLRQIVLPSARLPILAIGLLAFLVSWKEYFYSFVVSSGENSRTLPLLLSAMMAGEVPQWHLLFALSVVLILPGIALVTVATRMGISGRTEGGARD